MGVSVTMQLQFQQVFVEYVEVPQLQFDRVVVQLLHRDRYTVQTVQKSVVILQVQFLDRLGHAPRCATTGWMVQTVQKTGEVPQVQYLIGWSMFPLLQFIDKVWMSL